MALMDTGETLSLGVLLGRLLRGWRCESKRIVRCIVSRGFRKRGGLGFSGRRWGRMGCRGRGGHGVYLDGMGQGGGVIEDVVRVGWIGVR